MDTEGEPEIDSDLEDPDLDDLESLRKALGTHYTAVSPPLRPSHTLRDIHMARNAQQCLKTAVRRADEFPFVMASRGAMTQIVRVIRMGETEPDAQQQCRSDAGQQERQGEGLDDPDALAGLPGSHQGLPIGSPGAFQQQIALQNGTEAHAASGEAADDDERDSAADEDEEDDEEWEPAPTRTELLRDAVQYLQQSSAEQEALQDPSDQQEEVCARTCCRAAEFLTANVCSVPFCKLLTLQGYCFHSQVHEQTERMQHTPADMLQCQGAGTPLSSSY